MLKRSTSRKENDVRHVSAAGVVQVGGICQCHNVQWGFDVWDRTKAGREKETKSRDRPKNMAEDKHGNLINNIRRSSCARDLNNIDDERMVQTTRSLSSLQNNTTIIDEHPTKS